jgi:hypothetical protein
MSAVPKKKSIEMILEEDTHVSITPSDNWNAVGIDYSAFGKNAAKAKRCETVLRDFLKAPYVIDKFSSETEMKSWLYEMKKEHGEEFRKHIASRTLSKDNFKIVRHSVKAVLELYDGEHIHGIDSLGNDVIKYATEGSKDYASKSPQEKADCMYILKLKVYTLLQFLAYTSPGRK